MAMPHGVALHQAPGKALSSCCLSASDAAQPLGHLGVRAHLISTSVQLHV